MTAGIRAPDLNPGRGQLPDLNAINTFLTEATLPDLGPNTLPAEIQFKTDDPKREFYTMLLEHLKDRIQTADPINRPQPGDNPDRVTKAMRSIVAASKQQQPTWRKFKTCCPRRPSCGSMPPGRTPRSIR